MELIYNWVPKLDSFVNEYQIYHKSYVNGPHLHMNHISFTNEYSFTNEEWPKLQMSTIESWTHL